MRLVARGKRLEDYYTIRDYGLQSGDNVHMVLALRGGIPLTEL